MKGYEGDKPIAYTRKPLKIEVEELGQYSCCDNCAGSGKQKAYRIKYSKTDYALPSGNIGQKRYAKPRELWLCEDCLKELQKAIKEVLQCKN